MKWLKRIGLTLLVIYALGCGFLYFIQEQILFRPDTLPESYTFREGTEVEVEVEPGVSLNCLWLKTPNPKGVILYLHGNRGSLKRCLYQTRMLRGHGYDIFMPDYRGYGKSDGEIVSEAQVFSDNQKVYDYLKKYYSEDQIVVLGYSIGSGMAAALAADNHPQQLFLVAPYYCISDLKDRRAPFVPDFLLKYKFKTHDFLRQLTMPVTLIHGVLDNVIPFDSSRKLEAVSPGNVEVVPVPGEGHRGVIFSPILGGTLDEKLK
ncbi:MAG: alpha/beta fold hydrolase [Bacteroidetes bacterium]|nr:MAG: alpha/beta fold hydrolase [Bacteroidota bacterium]